MTLMERRMALMMANPSGGKSDMNGWANGVPYTDLTVIANSYYTDRGAISAYPGWKRTGYVPCEGASTITFPPMTEATSTHWNCFFDANHAFVSNFTISKSEHTTISVPASASFFGVSNTNSILDACISAGIVPHA